MNDKNQTFLNTYWDSFSLNSTLVTSKYYFIRNGNEVFDSTSRHESGTGSFVEKTR